MMSVGSGTVTANEVNKRLTREKDKCLPIFICLRKNNPEIIVNLTAMLWFPQPRELASPLIYHARIYAAAIEKRKTRCFNFIASSKEKKIVSRADRLNNTISTTDPNA